jgi:hypothetical protein
MHQPGAKPSNFGRVVAVIRAVTSGEWQVPAAVPTALSGRSAGAKQGKHVPDRLARHLKRFHGRVTGLPPRRKAFVGQSGRGRRFANSIRLKSLVPDTPPGPTTQSDANGCFPVSDEQPAICGHLRGVQMQDVRSLSPAAVAIASILAHCLCGTLSNQDARGDTLPDCAHQPQTRVTGHEAKRQSHSHSPRPASAAFVTSCG